MNSKDSFCMMCGTREKGTPLMEGEYGCICFGCIITGAALLIDMQGTIIECSFLEQLKRLLESQRRLSQTNSEAIPLSKEHKEHIRRFQEVTLKALKRRNERS